MMTTTKVKTVRKQTQQQVESRERTQETDAHATKSSSIRKNNKISRQGRYEDKIKKMNGGQRQTPQKRQTQTRPCRRNERGGQQEPTGTQNRKQEGKEGKSPAIGPTHSNKCKDPLQDKENQHHASYTTIQQIGRTFKRLPNGLTISPASYTLAIKQLHTDITTSSSKPPLEPDNNK